MLDELPSVGLTDAARRLGVEPFEVVRLLVVSKGMPDGPLMLTENGLERLRDVAGIEWWWEDGTPVPEDDNPRRAVARAAVGQLLRRRIVGDRSTRIDNLWRGRSLEDRELLQRVATILVQRGAFTTVAGPMGLHVSVASAAVSMLERMVNGETMPRALTGLW